MDIFLSKILLVLDFGHTFAKNLYTPLEFLRCHSSAQFKNINESKCWFMVTRTREGKILLPVDSSFLKNGTVLIQNIKKSN